MPLAYSSHAPDYYSVLGVPEDASFPQIEAAYWQRARRLRGQELDRLNEAYEVLNNDDRRRAYDEKRRATRAEAQAPQPEAKPAEFRPRSRLFEQFGAR
jgi:curved DNA-binding protein CbpA